MKIFITFLMVATLVLGSSFQALNANAETNPTYISEGDPLIDGIDWDDWLESVGQTVEGWFQIDGIDWDDWLESIGLGALVGEPGPIPT